MNENVFFKGNPGYTHNGKRSKVERFNWDEVDGPGEFMMIDKFELHVDHEYQRGEKPHKIREIAAHFRWVAFGVIIVGVRNGRRYVIDGQQRLGAARLRSDVDTVPCMVFGTKGNKDEAEAFLQVNKNRKPITSLETFSAMVMSGDPLATRLKSVLDQHGYEAVQSVGCGKHVKCVSVLLKLLGQWPEAFVRVFPVVAEAAQGGPIYERVIESLTYIEYRLDARGMTLTKKPWRERVVRLGPEGLKAACAKASAYYQKGGAKVWAHGVVQALNYKTRNPLSLDASNKDVDEDGGDDE